MEERHVTKTIIFFSKHISTIYMITKWSNLRIICIFEKQKCFQLQRLRPLTPDQGLCPWIPLGALPQAPLYTRALRSP